MRCIHALNIHIHSRLSPPSYRQIPTMSRYDTLIVYTPIPHTYTQLKASYRSLVEFSNQGFWLPGGAVDLGERMTDAARRETQEEGTHRLIVL